MIDADVIAADALKGKLKVMASDNDLIGNRERFIVTGFLPGRSARRL
ncbi:hypothetical protein [Pseudomonas poae]